MATVIATGTYAGCRVAPLFCGAGDTTPATSKNEATYEWTCSLHMPKGWKTNLLGAEVVEEAANGAADGAVWCSGLCQSSVCNPGLRTKLMLYLPGFDVPPWHSLIKDGTAATKVAFGQLALTMDWKFGARKRS